MRNFLWLAAIAAGLCSGLQRQDRELQAAADRAQERYRQARACEYDGL